jgi:hypothetical protein
MNSMFRQLDDNPNYYGRIAVIAATIFGLAFLLFIVFFVLCWTRHIDDDFAGYIPPSDLQMFLFWSATAGTVIGVGLFLFTLMIRESRRRPRGFQ